MVDAAYEAWRADCAAGEASILVTESARAVRALNERARAERLLLDGAVDGHEVELADGCRASVGDVVITRRNDRTHPDDARRVGQERRPLAGHRHPPRRLGRGQAPRTAASGDGQCCRRSTSREHVDLGYAVTAHRAQGITVDTSHVVVTPSTTRENLYVSMTRGRESNIAYVALDQPDDSHSTPEPDDVTAGPCCTACSSTAAPSLSAHQTIEAEYELHGGIDRLAAELETIAADAQHDRFVELLQPIRADCRAARGGRRVDGLRPAHRGAPPGRGVPPRPRATGSARRRPARTRRRRRHRRSAPVPRRASWPRSRRAAAASARA